MNFGILHMEGKLHILLGNEESRSPLIFMSHAEYLHLL